MSTSPTDAETADASEAAALERDVAEVHPDLRALYRQVRPLLVPDLTRTAAERRAMAEEGPGLVSDLVEGAELHEVRDLEIPVAGDTIPARLYRPTADAVLPGHVHLHGGGWILGSIDSADGSARLMAARTGAAVVSVSYRLAPEHPWPTGPEDCFAATWWIHDHAGELGIDASDVSIGGDSAGGNLATVVALMARDRGGPTLAAQWLMIGAYDLTLPETASLARYGRGFVLDRDEVQQTIDWYVGDADRRHPHASPMFADLRGLPPAVVVSATCDPIADQSVAYAARLRTAGVEVTEIRCAGHLHGSILLTAHSPSAKAYFDEAVAALAEARARPRSAG